MKKSSREKEPYKKLLSVFEIDALVSERAGSPVFRTYKQGLRTLEIWLKELRFNQAFQIAQELLGTSIDQQEFQDCWARTELPKKKTAPSEPPNTATFGGFRLKGRTALNRDNKQKPRPKKN